MEVDTFLARRMFARKCGNIGSSAGPSETETASICSISTFEQSETTVGDLWPYLSSKDRMKWLSNIKRPYYARSLHLFSVCQCLPEARSREQQSALKELFTLVEEAIQAGILRKDPKDAPKRDVFFDNAWDALKEYMAKFESSFGNDTVEHNPILRQTFGAAPIANFSARSLIETVQRRVEEQIKAMRNAKRVKMCVKFWKEEPLTWTAASPKPLYTGEVCTVEIEETATLAILLHRCFEFRVILGSDWNIHFEQYPYFYRDSPFPPRPYSKRIPSEDAWKVVREYMHFSDKGSGSPLHIILDRTNPAPISILNDKSMQELSLPRHYRNAWQVDTNPVTLIVRNRTPSMSLTSWTPYNELAPQGSGFASSSGTTFNDNSSTNSFSQVSVALSPSVTLAPETNIAVTIKHPATAPDHTPPPALPANPTSPASGISSGLPMHMPVPQPAPQRPASMPSLGSSASPRNDESTDLESPSSVVDTLCGTGGSSVRSISLSPLDILDESETPIESINIRVGEYLAALDNDSIAQTQVYPPVAGSNYPYQLPVGQPCCYTCLSPAYLMAPSNANYNSGNVWKNSVNNVGNTTINVEVYYPGVPMTDSPVAETDSAMDDEDYSKSPTHVHDQKHGTVISDTSRRNTV